MSYYERLTIYKTAMDLAVVMDKEVRTFSRAHKYSLGLEIKGITLDILRLIAQANNQNDRLQKLVVLCIKVEELKILCNLGKEVKAFNSFKQFMLIIEQVMNLMRQAEGWRRSILGQNSNTIK